MALLFLPVTIASGILVAHIQGGQRAVLRSLPLVVVAGGIMGGRNVWARVGWRAPGRGRWARACSARRRSSCSTRTPLLVGARRDETVTRAAPAEGTAMPPMLAFMPYFVLIALSFGAQVGPVKEAVSGLRLALDYPGFTTGQGFTVAPADTLRGHRAAGTPRAPHPYRDGGERGRVRCDEAMAPRARVRCAEVHVRPVRAPRR